MWKYPCKEVKTHELLPGRTGKHLFYFQHAVPPSLLLWLAPSLSLSLSLYPHRTLTFFFGRWYGGPRCYISLANGEQRGAGSVLHSRCPLLLKSSCLQLSNSTHMRKSCGSTGSITHTWQPEAAASSHRKVHFFPRNFKVFRGFENKKNLNTDQQYLKVWYHVGIK